MKKLIVATLFSLLNISYALASDQSPTAESNRRQSTLFKPMPTISGLWWPRQLVRFWPCTPLG